MKILGFIYRFLSNFAFLAMVYYSLNFMETYQQRVIVSALVLSYALTRAVTAMRSFYFFGRIERLEAETKRLAALVGSGPGDSNARKMVVAEVGEMRRNGEVVSYIDLLFLILIVLLCLSKIVM
jgi:hypothetical protein